MKHHISVWSSMPVPCPADAPAASCILLERFFDGIEDQADVLDVHAQGFKLALDGVTLAMKVPDSMEPFSMKEFSVLIRLV